MNMGCLYGFPYIGPPYNINSIERDGFPILNDRDSTQG
jgi:hypothetical protein